MTKQKMIILDVPKAVAKDVNKRAVDALRINIEYAATLDERGEQYAWANTVDVSVRGWLMMMMEHNNFTATQSLECFMELLTESVIPAFLKTDFVMADILKEGVVPKADPMSKVDAALREAGFEREFMLEGDSIDDIIAHLTDLRDSQNATKQ